MSNKENLFEGLTRTNISQGPVLEEDAYYIFKIVNISGYKSCGRTIIDAKFVLEDGTVFIERYYLQTRDRKPNAYGIEAFIKLVEGALQCSLSDDNFPTEAMLKKCTDKFICTNVYYDKTPNGRIYEHLNPYDILSVKDFSDTGEGEEEPDAEEETAE